MREEDETKGKKRVESRILKINFSLLPPASRGKKPRKADVEASPSHNKQRRSETLNFPNE
jgi:hypothetical protein